MVKRTRRIHRRRIKKGGEFGGTVPERQNLHAKALESLIGEMTSTPSVAGRLALERSIQAHSRAHVALQGDVPDEVQYNAAMQDARDAEPGAARVILANRWPGPSKGGRKHKRRTSKKHSNRRTSKKRSKSRKHKRSGFKH
jgi:hypothetical protein